MNKIAFFGASVTQQKNGYWKYFSNLNPNFNVKNFGYGGMQIWNAGICYIDDVLEFNPEYCFIDWLGTSFVFQKNAAEVKNYIDTIINRFYAKGVKIVFLIFPTRWIDRENVYKELKNYLHNLGVPVIDLFHSFKDLDLILRDDIHTTEYGAEQYAKLITDIFLRDIFCKIRIPDNYPCENKYCRIKKIDVNEDIFEKMLLDGDCQVISFSQVVGPHSGFVAINGELFNNWDGWCYYERDHMKLDFPVSGPAILDVFQGEFDRSVCKYKCKWSNGKMIKLRSIYYIGKSLNIISYK